MTDRRALLLVQRAGDFRVRDDIRHPWFLLAINVLPLVCRPNTTACRRENFPKRIVPRGWNDGE